MIPFLRKDWIDNGNWNLSKYDQKDNIKLSDFENRDLRYQTLASDILLEGAFNINSTSVDTWVSQLTALKGLPVPGHSYPSSETPVPRFLNQSKENAWNKLRSLDDSEVILLAKSLVKQIKLRGPFLSFSDFVNRRLQMK